MADLTQTQDIGPAWREISAPLNMADATPYRIDITGNSGDSIFFAETDAANPAPTVAGHLVVRINSRPAGADFLYTKRAGVFAWIRTTKAAGRMTVSETS